MTPARLAFATLFVLSSPALQAHALDTPAIDQPGLLQDGGDADGQEQESAEAAKRRALVNALLVPETSLGIATVSPHWHVSGISMYALFAVDVHGAVDGPAPNTRRMPTADFTPESHRPAYDEDDDYYDEAGDFVVRLEEYDCTQPGRFRVAATARYNVDDGTPSLISAGKSDDTKWLERGHDNWTWACKGDQKKNALPAGQDFVQLLDWYRAQVAAAKARAQAK